MSKKPETCEHSKFDRCWGEYKCTYYSRRIHDPDECKTCVNYKERKKKEEVKDDGEE